jgi:hypothetical protein
MENFVARKDLIEEYLNWLPPPEKVEVTLVPEQLAEGKMDEHFCCPICTMVVIDPEECG